MKMLKMLTGVAVCGVILICNLLLNIESIHMSEQTDCLFFQNQNGNWSGKEIIRIRENEKQQDEPQQFTVWGQADGQQVQNPELARKAETSALWLLGPSSLVITEPIYLEEKDTRGCLIGEHTAQELFGSSEVVGRSVVIGEQNLIIRGVLRSISDVLVRNAAENEDVDGQVLNRLNLKRTAGDGASWNGDDFLIRNSMDAVQIPYPMVLDRVSLSQLLLPFTVLVTMISFLGKRLSQNKNQPFACGLLVILLCTAVIVWVKLFWPEFTMAQKIAPGKWSDFNYFTALWKQEVKAAAQMEVMEKTVIDAKIWSAFHRSQLYTFVMFLGILLHGHSPRGQSDEKEYRPEKH
ncbi:MAG: ABC transporter permease [Hespellia sp.]|nr:ABC transporter permease [Hespellia sp.]